MATVAHSTHAMKSSSSAGKSEGAVAHRTGTAFAKMSRAFSGLQVSILRQPMAASWQDVLADLTAAPISSASSQLENPVTPFHRNGSRSI
jgi:hypothetical protein